MKRYWHDIDNDIDIINNIDKTIIIIVVFFIDKNFVFAFVLKVSRYQIIPSTCQN